MNNNNPLFNLAIEFLKNGGDLPDNIGVKTAKDRFLFTAACLQEIHNENAMVGKIANMALTESRVNKTAIKVMNTKISLLGGLTIIASAVLATLKILAVF
jgi:hypothetical protein